MGGHEGRKRGGGGGGGVGVEGWVMRRSRDGREKRTAKRSTYMSANVHSVGANPVK